ncbi:hypothetical protein ES703_25837 [subsurface metagenome]
MTELETLTAKLARARAGEHLRMARLLHAYLQTITDDDFRRQVSQAKNIKVFSYLLAAGLSQTRQDIISERARELS